MNRRNFFTRTLGLFVAGIAARYVPKGPAAAVGTVGAIDRATFSFWRNQRTTDPAKVRAVQGALDRAMRRLNEDLT